MWRCARRNDRGTACRKPICYIRCFSMSLAILNVSRTKPVQPAALVPPVGSQLMSGSDILEPTRLRQGDVAFQAQLYEAENPTRRWLHTTRRDWVMQAIDANLSTSPCKVLEVGVGAGLFTRHLSQQSCQVLAIDINPTFLHAVADLPGVNVREADVAT